MYADDIVIYGSTAEECIKNLKEVLETAEQYNLNFNWSKCYFMKTRIDFLSHIVENDSISPSEVKTNAVTNFPVPKNIKDVHAFLGLTGNFRKFVYN